MELLISGNKNAKKFRVIYKAYYRSILLNAKIVKRRKIVENYNLGADEVVLYKGEIKLKSKFDLLNNSSTELILTNLNIVFITTSKQLLSKEETNVEVHAIEEIKVYQGQPQIKTKGTEVEIYFLEKEIEFSFSSKGELNKFSSAAMKLITGKSTAERVAEKTKGAIALVDDTLGIDSVHTVGKVAGTAMKNTKVGTAMSIIGGVSGLIGKIGKKK